MRDYLKYYDLEKYLFDYVGPKFRASGKLEPLDLFLILVWKAPRAKTKNRDKLKNAAGGSFEKAAEELASCLRQASSPQDRLLLLLGKKWKLYLPTATAILSVLYPEDFTVYDVRVREQLGLKEINLTANGDTTWQSYLKFKRAVLDSGPSNYSLRDKDRYLWGKSLFEDAERDWRK